MLCHIDCEKTTHAGTEFTISALFSAKERSIEVRVRVAGNDKAPNRFEIRLRFRCSACDSEFPQSFLLNVPEIPPCPIVILLVGHRGPFEFSKPLDEAQGNRHKAGYQDQYHVQIMRKKNACQKQHRKHVDTHLWWNRRICKVILAHLKGDLIWWPGLHCLLRLCVLLLRHVLVPSTIGTLC